MDIKTKHSLPPSVKNYKHLINLEIFPANLKWAKLIKGLIFLPRRKTTAKNDRIRIATSSSINVERRGKKNWGLLHEPTLLVSVVSKIRTYLPLPNDYIPN